jgi:DNA-binding transcriptional LysR family regulator
VEIYQLRSFVTVARLGHVTRAAEALHLTQPAVTAQIKALEEELGLALFDRRPGRSVITRAGETILPQAEQVLSSVGLLLGRAKELKGSLSGQLVIGTVGDPDSLRLGSILERLIATLPLVDIKTRQGHADELRELVATEALHGAFHVGTAVPREVSGLQLQQVHHRIAAPFHMKDRLVQAGWSELAGMPWIGAPARHHARSLLSDLFARQGLTPNIVVESDESSSPQSLVRSGVGLALLREDVALSASEREEMALWPHARVPAVLSFIYSRTAEHDPLVVAAVSQVRQVWGLMPSERGPLE